MNDPLSSAPGPPVSQRLCELRDFVGELHLKGGVPDPAQGAKVRKTAMVCVKITCEITDLALKSRARRRAQA